ncbi:M23 family metallopeptidase [Labedella endophytica]|uniref:M23 family metallopeptidase n=1 Tax=Labedella endophytica TaxID=1523160 RepID=A0A433JQN9_9MICO|nr:M23 family metallopeptidase [Labedella endophytica]RUQ99218.1 M23 family metallopeptidase [Labedella endophytica]
MSVTHSQEPSLLTRRTMLAGAALVAASSVVADVLLHPESADAASGWYHPFTTRRAIRSDFGPRSSPCAGCSSFHRGLDYSPGRFTPIHAVRAGTVIYRRDVLGHGQFESNSFGNVLTIDHGGGLQTVYAHLERGSVAKLGWVAAGTQIGQVGHNGSSTGPHLHIEVRQDNASIDPAPKIHLAPLAPISSTANGSSDLERHDMLMISSATAFKNVTAGYTALVGFKSLHHLSRIERDALITHGKMVVRAMGPDDFEAILRSLQIPLSAAVGGANYDGNR